MCTFAFPSIQGCIPCKKPFAGLTRPVQSKSAEWQQTLQHWKVGDTGHRKGDKITFIAPNLHFFFNLQSFFNILHNVFISHKHVLIYTHNGNKQGQVSSQYTVPTHFAIALKPCIVNKPASAQPLSQSAMLSLPKKGIEEAALHCGMGSCPATEYTGLRDA